MYEDSAQKMERLRRLWEEFYANYESLKAIIDRGLAILSEAIAIVREIQDAFPDEAARNKALRYLLETEAWYENLETLRLAAYEAAKRELRAKRP